MPRVLIADDERPLRVALERFVRSLGMDAHAVASGTEAVDKLQDCDLLLTDVKMPGLDGMELLLEARRRRPELPVVLLTSYGSVDLAVRAMRAGAANFVTKPFDLDELEQVICSALGRQAQKGPPGPRAMPSPVSPNSTSTEVFLGVSDAICNLRDLVLRVAKSDATVLVVGESGSGKEVVARALHAQSRRGRGPFVAVNCGAIPDALIESELFGHARGAFTGATQNRPGCFATADRGTLLLDEIGELPLSMQVKLLRVLQEHTYTPLGEAEPRPADVRVIAATHRDLEAMVATGAFREDLYYRLNILQIRVPSLRERGDDVVLLARKFLEAASLTEGRLAMGMDDDVVTCLRRYAWPGNVRELEHAVTCATVMSKGSSLTLADLPGKVRAAFSGAPQLSVPQAARAGDTLAELPESGVDLKYMLESVEREMIKQALERTGGNKNRAAALLGMNRTTLVEKLKRLA
jgi:DNA-binding NtrC family response regulator